MTEALAVRQNISDVETALSQCEGAFVGDADVCPLKHSFADGMYVREISIPAGVLLVGKIHRHSHPNFLMQGTVSVITEAGGQETLVAPCHMVSPAGTKRVVYTHSDCVWVTVHVTDSTDLDEIEDQVIAPDYNDEELNVNQLKTLEEIKCLG